MATFPDPALQNALEPGCSRCPELVACRTRISWGVGPLDAELVVVGEAPAAGDPSAGEWQGGNHTGLAYTSRASGRKVRDLVADLDCGDAYYTNAVKCFPCAGEGNREPTAEERANCRPFLLREIERVSPDCVLATGTHATTTLLEADGRSMDGFLDTVLTPIKTDFGTVLPLLHPSYQEVWLSRLGHTRGSYVAAVRDAIQGVRM